MTFNNSATYTTIQLSQILQNLADIFECSDREKIVKLYADWIVASHADYTLTSNLENDNEQL